MTTHLDDWGTVLTVDMGVDISDATVKEIRIKKPGGDLLEVDATFTTDGTDCLIYYDFGVDGLDEVGTWTGQGHIETPTGGWSGDWFGFRVEDNLS